MAQSDIEDVVENVNSVLETLTELAKQLKSGQVQPSEAADKLSRSISSIQHEMNVLGS